jgi:hypothetical protein
MQSLIIIAMDIWWEFELFFLGYEAQTPLGGGVSRCLTCVGVWHLYDTRMTHVGIVKQVSPIK